MKVNLILLALLAALLGFAYYWEERGGKISSEQQLIIKSPLSLTLSKLSLVKKGEQWFLEDYGVPIEKAFSALLNRMLGGLMISSRIQVSPQKESEYFSQTNLNFKINNKSFILGDYSNIDKGFFIKRGEELFLVKDSTDYEGVFKSLDEEEYKKYSNLKNLIESDPSYLFPTRIIHSSSPLQSIIHYTNGSMYKLDIQFNETFPKPLKGLNEINILTKVDELNFTGKILNITLQKSQPKQSPISKMIITSKEGTSEYWLLNQYDKKEGLFIWNSNKGLILEVESIDDSLFSSSVSDFWNKKLSLLSKIENKKSLGFTMIKGSQKVRGQVLDTSKFSYSSKEFSFDRGKLNLLFGILLNNTPFEQASFVRSKARADFDFHLEVDEHRYSFKSSAGLLNVYEHSSQIEFVFIRPKASLPQLKFEELFTLKEKKP